MDERIVQFRVGVLVFASVIVAGILVVLFGSLPTFTGRTKTINISFPQGAMGVSRETPVRKFGILIGRVTEVGFGPDGSGVMVTAWIKSGVDLKTNEICQVSGSLLGGDAVIQFIGKNDKIESRPIESGDTLVGLSATDPSQAISNLETTLAQAVSSVATTSDEIGKLARRVTDILDSNDEQVARVANKAEETLDRLRSIATNTDEILGDDKVRTNLKQAMTELPDTLRNARQAIGSLKSTLDTADRNLQNIEGLTKPLGQRGPQLVENIDRMTTKMDRVLDDLSRFSVALNDPNGSIGQLMHDPELYRRVNSAVSNIETITREMRPVIRDVRVFSNKIARHPELIGVGGALRPSDGSKPVDESCPPSPPFESRFSTPVREYR